MTKEKAEELIQKYAGGVANEDEVKQLMNWYRSASINEVQWPVSSAGEPQEIHNRMLQRLQKMTAPTKARIISMPWLKRAAIFIILIGAGFLASRFIKDRSASYITVTNPPGNIQLVQLPDSSKVWLNAGTELRYATRFTKNRKVTLNGEAYFEVTPDAAHPFTITTGAVQTTVTGTAFNIKAYETDDKTTVSVTNGTVKVTNDSKEHDVLKPAMQWQMDKKTGVTKMSTIDTNFVIAWKKGRLQFEGESLDVIARTLERWFTIKILFTDPTSRSCRYYMGFNNSISLKDLLSAITQLTGMQYTLDKKSKTVTLSGKGCS